MILGIYFFSLSVNGAIDENNQYELLFLLSSEIFINIHFTTPHNIIMFIE